MSFSQRLQLLRKKHNMTQLDLAGLVGVGKTTISNYETGYSSPDIGTVNKMASLFNVSIDYLLGNALPVSTVAEDSAILLSDTRKVPIYRLRPKNKDNIFAPENIIGWQPVPANIIAQRGFIIEDDCMSSKINKGDIVLIKSQSSFTNGQAVLAKLPDGSIIIRKATHTNDGVILSPDNPKYQPQVYEDKDVFIIGIVEKIITDYK